MRNSNEKYRNLWWNLLDILILPFLVVYWISTAINWVTIQCNDFRDKYINL